MFDNQRQPTGSPSNLPTAGNPVQKTNTPPSNLPGQGLVSPQTVEQSAIPQPSLPQRPQAPLTPVQSNPVATSAVPAKPAVLTSNIPDPLANQDRGFRSMPNQPPVEDMFQETDGSSGHGQATPTVATTMQTASPVEALPRQYETKTSILQSKILVFVVVILVIAIIGFVGWWAYGYFSFLFVGDNTNQNTNVVVNQNTNQNTNTNTNTNINTNQNINTNVNTNINTNQNVNNNENIVIPNDTDGDGLSDDEERALGTDHKDVDTDDDGLTDYSEKNIYQTDPLNNDTDGDSFKDGDEVINGFDPTRGGGARLFDIPR